MKSILAVAILFLSGCSTIEKTPFVGGLFGTIHSDFEAQCRADPDILGVKVGKFKVALSCGLNHLED